MKFDCCGVSGPEDFEESFFRLRNHDQLVPEACCQRNSYLGDAGVEQCVSGSVAFRHNKVIVGSTWFLISSSAKTWVHLVSLKMNHKTNNYRSDKVKRQKKRMCMILTQLAQQFYSVREGLCQLMSRDSVS